jgi:hypothetical protein
MNADKAKIQDKSSVFLIDAFAKTRRMAKQKIRPTRLGGFSGAKATIRYVEVRKKRRNAVGRTFCDAILIYLRMRSIRFYLRPNSKVLNEFL